MYELFEPRPPPLEKVRLSKSSHHSRKGIVEASVVRSRTMLKFCMNTIAIMIMLQIVEMVDLGVHAVVGDASVKYIRVDEVGLEQVSVPEEIVVNEHQDARRKLQEAEDAGPSVDGEVDDSIAEASSENGAQEDGESTPGSDGARSLAGTAEEDGGAEEEAAAEGTADGQGDDALEKTSQGSPAGGNNAGDADPATAPASAAPRERRV